MLIKISISCDSVPFGNKSTFTLLLVTYHIRVDKDGTQFWNDIQNNCTIPGCEIATMVVTLPVTVTVEDTNGVAKEGVPVYAFDGSTYTGYNGPSDANGEVTLTLPEGSYRFRTDYDGMQFWSDDVAHCMIPGCLEAVVEIPGGVGEVNIAVDFYYDPLYHLLHFPF